MSKGKQCKVLGCDAIIDEGCSRYQQKKRVCAEHLRADAVRCKRGGDELYRFCQQCGKLERLAMFQGKKRSCRMSLAKRRSGTGNHQDCSDDNTHAASRHPTAKLHRTGNYNSNSCGSDDTHRNGDARIMTVAATVAPADAAALLAEAWCSDNSSLAFGVDYDLEEANKESLMMMLENELLLAAGTAAAPVAAPAAGVQHQPMQLQLPTHAYMVDTFSVPYPNTTKTASAPVVPAAGIPTNAAARLHLLQTQFAALQAELMVLQNMHSVLQQLNGHTMPDAGWASLDITAQPY